MEQQTINLKDFLSVVVEKLNYLESNRLRQDGYTNFAFFNEDGSLTDNYKITLKEKEKYFYIDFGTSGAFMISKEPITPKHYLSAFPVGSVFNIKGYGTPNFRKYYGEVFNLNVELLHKLRYDYR